MSQVELVWGAFSLMMLGALISMCMKCQQTGSKQVKANVDSHRTQCEDREDFQQLPYLSSASRQPQMKGMYDMPRPSRSRELSSLNDLETCSQSRYQNIITEIQTEQDPTYVEPIPSDHYYNCQKVTRLSSGPMGDPDTYIGNKVELRYLSKEDDSSGYQNVTGTLKSSGHVLADVDIYENSLAIQIWKHSQMSDALTEASTGKNIEKIRKRFSQKGGGGKNYVNER